MLVIRSRSNYSDDMLLKDILSVDKLNLITLHEISKKRSQDFNNSVSDVQIDNFSDIPDFIVKLLRFKNPNSKDLLMSFYNYSANNSTNLLKLYESLISSEKLEGNEEYAPKEINNLSLEQLFDYEKELDNEYDKIHSNWVYLCMASKFLDLYKETMKDYHKCSLLYKSESYTNILLKIDNLKTNIKDKIKEHKKDMEEALEYFRQRRDICSKIIGKLDYLSLGERNWDGFTQTLTICEENINKLEQLLKV